MAINSGQVCGKSLLALLFSVEASRSAHGSCWFETLCCFSILGNEEGCFWVHSCYCFNIAVWSGGKDTHKKAPLAKVELHKGGIIHQRYTETMGKLALGAH